MALEKTEWGATWQVFLGMLIDIIEQIIGVPADKIEKAITQVEYFLMKKNKKVTVLEVQKLCDVLNFISRAILPGCAFTRHLYNMTQTKQHIQLLPHHHVKISAENRLDLEIWKRFLHSPSVYARHFMSDDIASALDIDMYSDAAKSWKRGFGAYCNKSWIARKWPKNFILNCDPSIEYLELCGVTTAVVLWIEKFKDMKICLFTDNKSVRNMVNSTFSSCKNCMVLITFIVLKSLLFNVRVFAKFVETKDNAKADALSRLEFR